MSVAFGCLGRGNVLEVTWQQQTDAERHRASFLMWGVCFVRVMWGVCFLFFQNNEETPECHRLLRTNQRQEELYKHLFLWGLMWLYRLIPVHEEENSAAVTCASTTAAHRSDWYCSSKQNDRAGEFKQLETNQLSNPTPNAKSHKSPFLHNNSGCQ